MGVQGGRAGAGHVPPPKPRWRLARAPALPRAQQHVLGAWGEGGGAAGRQTTAIGKPSLPPRGLAQQARPPSRRRRRSSRRWCGGRSSHRTQPASRAPLCCVCTSAGMGSPPLQPPAGCWCAGARVRAIAGLKCKRRTHGGVVSARWAPPPPPSPHLHRPLITSSPQGGEAGPAQNESYTSGAAAASSSSARSCARAAYSPGTPGGTPRCSATTDPAAHAHAAPPPPVRHARAVLAAECRRCCPRPLPVSPLGAAAGAAADMLGSAGWLQPRSARGQ